MDSLEFVAYGNPVTQGNVKSYPIKGGAGVRTVSKTPPLVEWREVVRHAAEVAAGPDWETRDGDAVVRLKFWLPRPKGAPKTRDIRPSKSRTDIDKLERAVYDSITNAGVWADDSRVVDAILSKRYAVGPALHHIYRPDYHRTMPCVEVKVTWYPED